MRPRRRRQTSRFLRSSRSRSASSSRLSADRRRTGCRCRVPARLSLVLKKTRLPSWSWRHRRHGGPRFRASRSRSGSWCRPSARRRQCNRALRLAWDCSRRCRLRPATRRSRRTHSSRPTKCPRRGRRRRRSPGFRSTRAWSSRPSARRRRCCASVSLPLSCSSVSKKTRKPSLDPPTNTALKAPFPPSETSVVVPPERW